MFTIGGVIFHQIKKVSRSRAISTVMKPPNILIKTNDLNEFTKFKGLLNLLLQKDRYTIYQLHNEGFQKQPWSESCALLCYCVTEHEEIMETVLSKVSSFVLKENRKVIFYDVTKQFQVKGWLEELDCRGERIEDGYKLFNHGELVIQILENIDSSNKLQNVLYELGLELTDEINEPEEESPAIPEGYYFDALNRNLELVFDMELVGNRIHFVSNTVAIPSAGSAMKVYTERSACKNFDWRIYLNSLQTDSYGKVLIYTDVITSTQTFLQDLRFNSINHDGFVLTARQQSRGKGRTGNTWLSPLGCMMFSMQILIPIDSNLGRSLPLIQHLVVVAFVRSIREKTGFEDLDLNIKWPNDIYVNRKIKIGGVIVNSTTLGSNFNIIIGLGVNISNEKPTTCLNHVIEEFMHNNRVKLRLLSIEEALAGTISQIEFLVKLFQVNGVGDFKKIYYQYWLHSNTTVTLQDHNNIEANILGIDDFGYLQVQARGGAIISLQPDGNSFDMMTNMIRIKTSM